MPGVLAGFRYFGTQIARAFHTVYYILTMAKSQDSFTFTVGKLGQ